MQHLEALAYFCDEIDTYYNIHFLLINSSTGKWYIEIVTILNTYVLHDLNGLDAYSLSSVHEQDSVVVRYRSKNDMCAIACMQYST